MSDKCKYQIKEGKYYGCSQKDDGDALYGDPCWNYIECSILRDDDK